MDHRDLDQLTEGDWVRVRGNIGQVVMTDPHDRLRPALVRVLDPDRLDLYLTWPWAREIASIQPTTEEEALWLIATLAS